MFTLHPCQAVRGTLQVPGDKSISHRYVLLGAIADGTTTMAGLAPGADVASTVACMRALGADIQPFGEHGLRIRGRGVQGLRAPLDSLDAGNSGTTLRLLSGVLAGRPFRSTLSGDDSLRRRPMGRIIDPLTAMGASISSQDGRAPLRIDGRPLQGIDWVSPVASAQVKSAVLLAGLSATGRTLFREPLPSRDHTERAFEVFEIELTNRNGQLGLDGPQQPIAPPAALGIPGDPSSAAVWAAAAAALPGSELRLERVGLNPRRLGFVGALERMGADITLETDSDAVSEPTGTLIVRYGARQPAEVAADEVPGLIDELPVLAASAAHGGHLTVSGAAELRVKESDRISALIAGLRRLGVVAEERPDGFLIDGSRRPTGGTADAAGDHRLVMAFAVVGLGASGPTTISGAGVVGVSYPGFAADLDRLAQP